MKTPRAESAGAALLTAAGVMLMVVLALGACGRKAAPVPPKRPPLPAVTDLAAAQAQEQVILRWRHPAGAQGVRGYVVLRAQTALERPECGDCPMIFQEVGTLKVAAGQEQVESRQMVPAGFRVTFKVQAFGAGGDRGPDSNLITLSLPKE